MCKPTVKGSQKRGQATFPESRGYAMDWKRESQLGKEGLLPSGRCQARGKPIAGRVDWAEGVYA